MNILRMPYGIKIWPLPLFITLWVHGHGVYKTIDFYIDLNISQMTGAMANLIVHAQVGIIGLKGPGLHKK